MKDRPTTWLGNEPPSSSRLLAMVTFTATTDLNEFARRRDFTVHDRASLCNGESFDAQRPIQGLPYVYDAAGHVDFGGKDPGTKQPQYYIYLHVTPIKLAGEGPPFQYDLRQDPQDVCVELRGGNMIGETFAPTVMKVSKEFLCAASHRASQGR